MQRVIIGVDPSETARRAAEEGVSLAESSGASVHFVTAVGKGALDVAPASGTDHALTTQDRAEALLADLASRYRSRVTEITTSAVDGKPADVIVDEAERVDADVIVVGNRRMHGAGRFLGAVANHVAHHANRHVFIANTVEAQ